MKKEEYKNLYQLHFQNKSNLDETELVAQKTITSEDEMRDWQNDVAGRHPLPDGMCWLICNWDSKYFVKAAIK